MQPDGTRCYYIFPGGGSLLTIFLRPTPYRTLNPTIARFMTHTHTTTGGNVLQPNAQIQHHITNHFTNYTTQPNTKTSTSTTLHKPNDSIPPPRRFPTASKTRTTTPNTTHNYPTQEKRRQHTITNHQPHLLLTCGTHTEHLHQPVHRTTTNRAPLSQALHITQHNLNYHCGHLTTSQHNNNYNNHYNCLPRSLTTTTPHNDH